VVKRRKDKYLRKQISGGSQRGNYKSSYLGGEDGGRRNEYTLNIAGVETEGKRALPASAKKEGPLGKKNTVVEKWGYWAKRKTQIRRVWPLA